MGMMVGGLLGGPLLAATTRLSAGAGVTLGVGLPVVLALAWHLRVRGRRTRALAARLAAEAELRRALHGRAAGPALAPSRGGIPPRAAGLLALAALCAVVQATVGGPLSAVLLGGLWAALLSPVLRQRLAAHVPHGDTQIGLVQARSETVRGIRGSSHSAGRVSSGSERQSRQDQRQVGSSTTRA